MAYNRQPRATVLTVHTTELPPPHIVRVILDTGATLSVVHHPALLRDSHTGDSIVIHSIGSTTNEVHTHGTLIGIVVPAILLVTSPFTILSYSSLARSHQVTYDPVMDRFTVITPLGVHYNFVR